MTMRFAMGMALCLALAGCSGRRAPPSENVTPPRENVTPPRVVDPTRCHLAYQRAVGDCHGCSSRFAGA